MFVTESWLRANAGKRREKVLEQADRDGLSVRVSAKGKIVFQIRYRHGEDPDPKRLDIGVYPRMGLKAARQENERLRGLLDKGHDPKLVLAIETRSNVTAESFEALFRQWYEAYCSKHKSIHRDILMTFEKHVFPEIGVLPGKDITLQHWLKLLDQHAEERPSICERILSNSKQCLKWCVKRQTLPINVLADIYAKEDFHIEKADRTARTFSKQELQYWWLGLNLSRLAFKNKLFLLLCLVFACRNGELRKSKKTQFDFVNMIWTVPPENHKRGKKSKMPIVRPIIPEIVPLLRAAFALSPNSEYVFTNNGTDEPMGLGAPLSMPYNVMQWLRRREKYEMEHWTVHDLRKTARTNFSSLSELAHVCEMMLGHALPHPWRVYDGHDYLQEMAVIYRAWWERLVSIFSTVDLTPRARVRSTPGASALFLPAPKLALPLLTKDSGSPGSEYRV